MEYFSCDTHMHCSASMLGVLCELNECMMVCLLGALINMMVANNNDSFGFPFLFYVNFHMQSISYINNCTFSFGVSSRRDLTLRMVAVYQTLHLSMRSIIEIRGEFL